jgi:hypothetical protein
MKGLGAMCELRTLTLSECIVWEDGTQQIRELVFRGEHDEKDMQEWFVDEITDIRNWQAVYNMSCTLLIAVQAKCPDHGEGQWHLQNVSP